MTRKRWLRAQRYVDARQATVKRLPQKLLNTKRRITALKVEIDAVAENMRINSHNPDAIKKQSISASLQAQMGSLRYRLNELMVEERLLGSLLDKGLPGKATALEEFNTFFNLHGVYSVDVLYIGQNLTLCLDVSAETEYYGRIYDLGDWQFLIDLEDVSFWSQSTRMANKPDWSPGTYPSYALPDGTFCFGANYDLIRRSVEAMDYVRAANVAVSCFHGINEDDESEIPNAFYEKRGKHVRYNLRRSA